MKFTAAAVATALVVSPIATAFTPAFGAGRATNAALHATVEATSTYSFAKSEEVFAEAQTVRVVRFYHS